MNRNLLLNLVFSVIFWSSLGQSLSYDVVKAGEEIGALDVSRKMVNGEEHFSVKSVVRFKLLFSFVVEYSLEEVFVDGVLERGKGFNTFNGSLQKETSISRKDGKYVLLIDGIEGYVRDNKITESVSKIYYSEPDGDKELYSQYFGRHITLEKSGTHEYTLISPDGENTYTYENGICTKVRVSRDFATFYFELKPESLAAVQKNKSSQK